MSKKTTEAPNQSTVPAYLRRTEYGYKHRVFDPPEDDEARELAELIRDAERPYWQGIAKQRGGKST